MVSYFLSFSDSLKVEDLQSIAEAGAMADEAEFVKLILDSYEGDISRLISHVLKELN